MTVAAARASRRSPSWRRCGAALGLLSVVSGCVALPAIPVAIGSALYARERARVRAATPVPAAPSGSVPAALRAADAAIPGPISGIQVTTLKELPPPSGPAAPAGRQALPEGWQRFFSYALGQSARQAGQGRAESALLAPGAVLAEPRRRPCPSPRPAVIVDLDSEERPFAPEQVKPASRELAEGLARLREAGITILWIAQVPAARAAEVANALRTSGLDPDGRDQLLLIRDGEDRKQVLREQANDDVCIVAIAGDRRGDFDELFDYLRNPAGAAGLYPMMGSGWFLVPPLSERPEAALADPAAGASAAP